MKTKELKPNRQVQPRDHYPAAMLNLTNRCNLSCSHCFVFRDGNANDPVSDIDDDLFLEKLQKMRDDHDVVHMLWMGGEPMLRKRLLHRALPLFRSNTITTNGTIPLVDFDTRVIYVISLDGPEVINDSIRGDGVFKRVMKNINRVPENFKHTVQCQMAVSKLNAGMIEDLIKEIIHSRFDHMTLSFYVPSSDDTSGHGWSSLEERDEVVNQVIELKKKYHPFIKNKDRSLQLMLSPFAKAVTDECLLSKYILPTYVEDKELIHPFCCYGNDVDCDMCGAWALFDVAARKSKFARMNYHN